MKKIAIFAVVSILFFMSYKVFFEKSIWNNRFFDLKNKGYVHVNDYIRVLGKPDLIKPDTFYYDDFVGNQEEFVLGFCYKYSFMNFFDTERNSKIFFVNDTLVGYGYSLY